jgi:hypothetical protein
MCLPNGRVGFPELVPSPVEAAQAFSSALARRFGDESRGPVIVATLEGYEGRLCARRYGVFGRGDRQSLSGKVTFRFAVTSPRPGEAARQVEITVKADHGNAAPARDLFARALTLLAGQI